MQNESQLRIDDETIFYSGKVRDVYSKKDRIYIVVSDRISAFDVILPQPIPYKGAVLNGISTFFLKETSELVPNWLIAAPNSHFCYGHLAPTIPIEVIVRGYISGSMWRAYEAGEREFCGNILPDGLKNNQKLPQPIITPTTKASAGHDENTSEEKLIEENIVTKEDWNLIKKYSFSLYNFGSEFAAKRNLILVDTKFEFGRKRDGTVILIDEILTPDSSRYFIADTYLTSFEKGESPNQLSKEFVRQWLIEQNFMGREGDKIPFMSEDWIEIISNRYIELYTKLLGIPFDKASSHFDIHKIQKIFDEVSNS